MDLSHLDMEQFTILRDEIRASREELREDFKEHLGEIVRRLDQINGTVRRHEIDIHILKDDAHPPQSCPAVFDVVKDVQELKTTAATNAKIAKLALAIGGVIAAVAQVLSQAIFR